MNKKINPKHQHNKWSNKKSHNNQKKNRKNKSKLISLNKLGPIRSHNTRIIISPLIVLKLYVSSRIVDDDFTLWNVR